MAGSVRVALSNHPPLMSSTHSAMLERKEARFSNDWNAPSSALHSAGQSRLALKGRLVPKLSHMLVLVAA